MLLGIAVFPQNCSDANKYFHGKWWSGRTILLDCSFWHPFPLKSNGEVIMFNPVFILVISVLLFRYDNVHSGLCGYSSYANFSLISLAAEGRKAQLKALVLKNWWHKLTSLSLDGYIWRKTKGVWLCFILEWQNVIYLKGTAMNALKIVTKTKAGELLCDRFEFIWCLEEFNSFL